MAERAEVVGSIAVKVEADYSGFAQRLEAALRAAVAQASSHAAFQPLVDEAQRAGQASGSGFGAQFSAGIDRERSRFTSSGRRSGTLFGRAFRGAGEDEATTFLQRLGNLLRTGVGSIPGVGGLGQVFSLFTGAASGGGPAITAGFVAAIPIVMSLVFGLIALAGWISQVIGLLGVLPTVFATSLALVIPLVVAFQGFGKALAAISSGDPKKITEAMKGLAPSARSVVTEFGHLLPLLRDIRKETQQRFFLPLVGDLTKLGAALGPTVKAGLASTAGMLGDLFHRGLAALSSPAAQAGLLAIIVSAQHVLEIFSGPVGHLFTAFGSAIIAAIGPGEHLAAILAGMVDRFAVRLDEWVANGKFEGWLNTALTVAGELKALLTEISTLFHTIFVDSGTQGEDTLQSITHFVERINEALKDPGAQHAIEGLIDLFNVLLGSMYVALTVIGLISLAIGTVIYYAEQLYHWLQKIMGLGTAEGSMKRQAADLAAGAVARRGLQAVNVPHFATGGVFTRPTVGLFAEAGAEAVVPLTDPRRAAQVLDEAGLTGMMGGGGQPPVQVRVFVGDREITDIVRVEVDQAVTGQARALQYGPRRM